MDQLNEIIGPATPRNANTVDRTNAVGKTRADHTRSSLKRLFNHAVVETTQIMAALVGRPNPIDIALHQSAGQLAPSIES